MAKKNGSNRLLALLFIMLFLMQMVPLRAIAADFASDTGRYSDYWLMTPGQGESLGSFTCSDGKGNGCGGSSYSSFLIYFEKGETDTSQSGRMALIVVTCTCGLISEWQVLSNGGARIDKDGKLLSGGVNNIQMGRAVFNAFLVKITFRAGDGGTFDGGDTERSFAVELGSDWNTGWEPEVLPFAGKYFKWWYVDGIGNYFNYELGELGPVISDLILTAQYTTNPGLTVTFDPNGGDDPSFASKEAGYDLPYGALATTNRAGYKFLGWYTAVTGGLGIMETSLVANPQDHTLYARWQEDPDITINYEATAGGTVSRPGESLAPATGAAQGSTAGAATGYRFVNWTNEAGAEVSTDLLFVPVKVDGLNVAATYTANFEIDDDDQTYTINYIARTGGSVNTASETHHILYTGQNNGSAATPDSGYTFIGWTNGNGQEVSRDREFVPQANEDATFYANFTRTNVPGGNDYNPPENPPPARPPVIPDEIVTIPEIDVPQVAFPDDPGESVIEDDPPPQSAMPKTSVEEMKMLLTMGLFGSIITTACLSLIITGKRRKERR